MTECAHCGKDPGTHARVLQGFMTVNGIRLCHPGALQEPEYYVRVCVYGETLGALRGSPVPPAGVAAIGADPRQEREHGRG